MELSGLLAHGMLDGIDNRGQDSTTTGAADQLPDHGADVGPAASGTLQSRNDQLQELPATHRQARWSP